MCYGPAGPILPATKTFGLYALLLKNLVLLGIRKRLACVLPMLPPCCCQQRKQSGKVVNFFKVYFVLKRGVDRFSKKLCFSNHQDVSFRAVYFTCKYASDPFQRTVPAPNALADPRPRPPPGASRGHLLPPLSHMFSCRIGHSPLL